MVSKPAKDSTKTALRCELAWKVCLLKFSKRCCVNKDTATIITMATKGGIIIYGEIQPNTTTNKNIKGRSTKVVRLAEAIKSRTDSKERKFDAKAPTEAGRPSIFMPKTCSIICADKRTSILLLALSTTRALAVVSTQLKSKIGRA